MASSMGLGRPDMAAPGVLKGFSLGVFRADKRGVPLSSSSSRIAVSDLDKLGLSRDASGRVSSSSIGGACSEPLKSGDGCMRMREAGVAGVLLWLLRWAMTAGEAVKELGLGGGRISESMGSGEMESVSELSRVRGASRPAESGCWERAFCTRSVTSLGRTSEEPLDFRLLGFTMGDCRTRALPLVRGATLLFAALVFLLPWSCDTIADSPSISMSRSMGEWPVELSEAVFCCG